MRRVVAPGYDLFKLVVTFILLIVLAMMLLRGCSKSQAESVGPHPSGTEVSAMATPSSPPPTATIALTVTQAVAQSTDVATSTALPEPSPTPVNPLPTAAATPTQPPALICNTSMPSRLSVGVSVQTTRRLNMRSSPEITSQNLQTNPTGTQVDIIDGPVCTPKGNSAYLWWKIRLANGVEGWSAETPLNDKFYFLEPIP